MSAATAIEVSTAEPRHSGLCVALLAISAFVIVTTEFLIVGLLPALARDLDLSIATAGMLVTLFAFVVMLFGPILTGLVSHLDRKRLFIVLLAIFAASNALAAVAPNIWVLALARFLPALALPIFWVRLARRLQRSPDRTAPARLWRASIKASPGPWCSASRWEPWPGRRWAGAGRSGVWRSSRR